MARVAQPATRVDTTCWQLFRPDINTAHFLFFFVAEVMSNYLTTDGLKIFSTSEGHLRPEARGICHICPMVNPALSGRPPCREHTKTLRSFVRLTRGSTSDWPRGFCWSFCWILDLIKEHMLNNMVCTRTAFGCWRLTFLQPITWRRFIAAASQLVTSEHMTKPAAVTTRAPDI